MVEVLSMQLGAHQSVIDPLVNGPARGIHPLPGGQQRLKTIISLRHSRPRIIRNTIDQLRGNPPPEVFVQGHQVFVLFLSVGGWLCIIRTGTSGQR